MNISLNGRAASTQAKTLAELVEHEGFSPERVATAVNEDFVPAALRRETALHDGDRVEILGVQQGG